MRAAAVPRPAAEWRSGLARQLAAETGAKLAAVLTFPPARPHDAEQGVVPAQREALVEELFDHLLPRAGKGREELLRPPDPRRAFAPLEDAADRKLAERIKRKVCLPAGISGLIAAALTDQVGEAIGWVVLGAESGSDELLWRWGETLTELAAAASGTLQLAVELAQAVGAVAPCADRALGMLSRREREIVRCVCSGLADGQVAHELGISEQTVGTHLKRIYSKLGVHSRVELVSRVCRVRPPPRRLKA